MFSADQYMNSIQINLEKQSDLLIGNLKKFFAYSFSSDTDLLDFTGFIEPTRFELAIRVFSMDKEGNEVFEEGSDTAIFAGSEEVLSDVAYYQLNGNQTDEFFDFYEDNEETLVP